jgi:hypothetical protein
MRFLNWLKSRFAPAAEDVVCFNDPGVRSVSFDEQEVRCIRQDGSAESVRWDNLQVVLIQTTDAGPVLDDMFWVLGTSSGGCIIPSEAKGCQELMARLQRLPEFDNKSVISAATCMDNKLFVCWRRDMAAEEGSH